MSSVAARRSTYIPPHPSLTGPRAVRRLPLMNWQWISFGEAETSAAAAGQNEFSLRVRLTGPWQSTITAASSSRDLWPPAPLPAPHLSRLGRRAGEAAVRQRVSLSLKPWCLPTFCSTGRAHRRAATVKCTIRRAWRPFFFFLTSITPTTTTSRALTL